MPRTFRTDVRRGWRTIVAWGVVFAAAGCGCWLESTGVIRGVAAAAEPAFTDEQLEFFEKQVRPLLAKRCFECHGPEVKEAKGALRFDSRASLLTGGDTGPAVLPGEPKKSLLIDSIHYGDLYQMPPKSKMPAEEIAVLEKWVAQGAAWPESESTRPAGGDGFNLAQRKAEHWAWRQPKAPAVPTPRDAAWPHCDIDRFVLAKLESAGLAPAAPADRATWLRRVSFDLTGLPPTVAELKAFLNDDTPEARPRVVERLLASPRFGERWARHWLDLARYAESRGHEFDYNIANAYQYRDYVIRAFNADTPYDQFVIEHLAGDLLPRPRLHAGEAAASGEVPADAFNESVLATGFWFLGEWVHSPVDIRKDEADRFDNMIDVFGKTFLGLTIGCARCHDHKFDALTQADYYALAGFLHSSTYRQARFDTEHQHRRIAEQLQSLENDTRRALLARWGAAQTAALPRLGEHLLAARQAIVAGVEWKDAQAAERELSAAFGVKIDEVAKSRGLDGAELRSWISLLEQARGRPDDLFHPWALVAFADAAAAKKGAPPDNPRATLAPLAASWRARREAIRNWGQELAVVVDVARLPARHWLQDGVSFGLAPRQPGEVLLGSDPRAPFAAVFTHAVAARDATWNGIKLAAGTEREAGRLGAWDRAGRVLRTPSFEIAQGKLFYLLRGKGALQAVVNSHRMLAGPLHNETVREFDTQGKFAIVEHDVARYVGGRAHVEFWPKDDAELEVRVVAQGAKNPGAPPNAIPGALLDAITGPAGESTEALAKAYQETLLATAANIARDAPTAGPAPAEEQALVVEWLLRRGELTGCGDKEVQADVAALLAVHAARRAEILARVRWESRTAPAMLEGNGVNEALHVRGNAITRGKVVPRGLPQAMADGESQVDDSSQGGASALADLPGSGRLELARRLASPSNPFVARVLVNRAWQHMFGEGLVPSVDNFGVLGQAPTHPELLDHLAVEFTRDGWSLKRLLQRIALSSAYQMASTPDARGAEIDPRNALLHRARARRLEGEAIRDAMLAVSGRLDPTPFGSPVPVHLTPFMQGRGRPGGGPLDGAGRRSVYLSVRRNFLSPMMLAFDTPAPFNAVGRRNVSNVPAQALMLMNDPFVVEQARLWAKRLVAEHPAPEARLRALYLESLSRPPSAEEEAEALAFLAAQAVELGLPAERAARDPGPWADLCHVMFNVKEFVLLY